MAGANRGLPGGIAKVAKKPTPVNSRAVAEAAATCSRRTTSSAVSPATSASRMIRSKGVSVMDTHDTLDEAAQSTNADAVSGTPLGTTAQRTRAPASP